MVVVEADCTRVGGLEHHIADSADKVYIVAEAGQPGADMLGPKGRV
jgi:hypothetical protein